VSQGFSDGVIVDSLVRESFDQTPTKFRAVPIRLGRSSDNSGFEKSVVAVLTRHSNLSESCVPGRHELTFNDCANDLFKMIAEAVFPTLKPRAHRLRGRREHLTG